MAKEKVTLTLDSEQLAQLRSLVGARSLSTTVDGAIAERLARLRHRRAVDEWLADLDEEHGPVPPELLVWAGQTIDEWAGSRPELGRQTG